MAQTEEFMLQNVAYRPTVYRTGALMNRALPDFTSGSYIQHICLTRPVNVKYL